MSTTGRFCFPWRLSRKPGCVRCSVKNSVMAQNFVGCDREQFWLLPPSLRDWLPEEHLAWFVLDAVEEMDLAAFYGAYRLDGWGRAAHDPAMMVALLLYAYAVGERSSRGIERRCFEDVAFRVIAANQGPDHATLARFRVRHELALAGLFGEVLKLCAAAGAVSVGVIAVDGTRMKANAADRANFSYEQLARRSSPRLMLLTRLRMLSSVSVAVMSCQRSWLIATRAKRGCARRRRAWNASTRTRRASLSSGSKPRPTMSRGREPQRRLADQAATDRASAAGAHQHHRPGLAVGQDGNGVSAGLHRSGGRQPRGRL